jgi:hypothetical protein
MTLKKKEDWPKKDLALDPWAGNFYWDYKSKTFKKSENGRAEQLLTLGPFGFKNPSGKDFLLNRNGCRLF